MKRWQPIRVDWLDAHGGDPGWEDPHDIPCKPAKAITVGMFYKQNKDGITVVFSRDAAIGYVGGYTFIPACNIISVEELQRRT